MHVNFQGKTALVTGSSSGIGRDITKKLIELGADVIAVGQTQSKLDSLKAELNNEPRLTTICVDIGNWKETSRKLSEACKKVDYLVNNAGVYYDSPLDSLEEDQVDHLLDVNLKAPMNLIRLCAKGMKERQYGSIVNVSSVSGIAALDNHGVYAASKAGLDMVTKVAAKELGPFKIRVNSVNPTVVWTAMGKAVWTEPKKKAEMISKIPQGRFVEVSEVVNPIVYLLSDFSGMVSGILMPIDGGFVAC